MIILMNDALKPQVADTSPSDDKSSEPNLDESIETSLLEKYEKYLKKQNERDLEDYLEMRPSQIRHVETDKYLRIFDLAGLPAVSFRQLIEIANTTSPLSIINYRLRDPSNTGESMNNAELDNRLNLKTYQMFFREEPKKSLAYNIRSWYIKLGAEHSFPELEAYKVRAAVLLLNSLKFEHVDKKYTIEYDKPYTENPDIVVQDKRQLAAELLLDAGLSSAFERHDTTHLELYINSVKHLLRKACFEGNAPQFELPEQRSAAVMLQDVITIEYFLRNNGYLEKDAKELQHLEKLLNNPKANLLYQAFETVYAAPKTRNHRLVGEQNELLGHILLAAAQTSANIPIIVRGAFEREDRPHLPKSIGIKKRPSSDLVMYTFSQEYDLIKTINFQVKTHYQSENGKPYTVSILNLSEYGELAPTMHILIEVLLDKRAGSKDAARHNMLTIFRMFMKNTKLVRSDQRDVIDNI